MRSVLYLCAASLVVAVAFWAYKINYRTQAVQAEVARLQQAIATERHAIAVLSAEWAYLNRPDQLRRLAEANFEHLGLMPLDQAHFGEAVTVAYPLPQGQMTPDSQEVGQ
ncbi:MAG: cell division protein FtsL [Pseudomonadota bacterium]